MSIIKKIEMLSLFLMKVSGHHTAMTTIFSFGAPIAAWMEAIRVAQQARFQDVPVVNEWSPNKSTWPYPPPPPPPSPVGIVKTAEAKKIDLVC